MSKVEDLKFIRVFVPDHIPTYLVEQIKDRDYSIENFYHYHRSMLLRETKEGPTFNPYVHVYVLANNENHVKGFLWLNIDPLTKNIFIENLSVDKKYWEAKKMVPKVAEFVKDIRQKANLQNVYWCTSRPKAYEKYGFKKSKKVLIEYCEEKNGKSDSRGERISGEHPDSEPRATAATE